MSYSNMHTIPTPAMIYTRCIRVIVSLLCCRCVDELMEIESFIQESMPELHHLASTSRHPLNPIAAIYNRVSVNSAYFVSTHCERDKVTRNSVVRVRVNERSRAHDQIVFNNGILDGVYCYNPYPTLKESKAVVLLRCEWYKNASTCSVTDLDRVTMNVPRPAAAPRSGASSRARPRQRRVNVFVDATSIVVTNVLVIRDMLSPESARISYVVNFEKRFC